MLTVIHLNKLFPWIEISGDEVHIGRASLRELCGISAVYFLLICILEAGSMVSVFQKFLWGCRCCILKFPRIPFVNMYSVYGVLHLVCGRKIYDRCCSNTSL